MVLKVVAAKTAQRTNQTMADLADRHELYEAAVQNVAEQCSFIDFIFKQTRGRKALSFREDFCGTASASCEWARFGNAHYAFGVDLDPEVLEWGREHRISELTKLQQQRVSLTCGNVLEVETPLVDVVGAFNFSYWSFATRSDLLRYFKTTHENLVADGMFFLDAYGGADSFTELQEEMAIEDFIYVWDQARYCPVTGQMQTHIHFEFPDGSSLQNAFSYNWRLWTLAEIREALAEAGFRDSTVWFEFLDDNGEGLGEWYPESEGDAVAAWVANITAMK